MSKQQVKDSLIDLENTLYNDFVREQRSANKRAKLYHESEEVQAARETEIIWLWEQVKWRFSQAFDDLDDKEENTDE